MGACEIGVAVGPYDQQARGTGGTGLWPVGRHPCLPSSSLRSLLLEDDTTGERLGGAGEAEYQPITGGFDLGPVMRRDDGAAGGEVRVPQPLVRVVSQAVGQPGRANEITEHDRYGLCASHQTSRQIEWLL